MKKILMISFMILLTAIVFPQENEPLKSNGYNRLNWGFNVGLNYSNIKPIQEPPFGSTMRNKAGVRIGVLTEYSPVNWFSLSPKIELSFNGAELSYITSTGNSVFYEVNPVTLEMAPHFKFIKQHSKLSLYCYTGPNLRLALNNQNNPSDFNSLNSVSLDFGIGFNKKLKSFNLSPEIRYSYGLINVNGNPIFQDVLYHNFALVFNFLG